MSAALARLHARPDAALGPAPLPPGTLVHVPADAPSPTALAVMLHGAGGSAASALQLVREAAEAHQVAVLAPQSAGRTWDMIERDFGPDVATIDSALAHVFASFAVDPARIALAGFSDGASYALSLGLRNGDLATHLIAFSPGFATGGSAVGWPKVLITHGTEDRVLPIDRCGRRVAWRLHGADYDVRYEEFDGGHVVPPALADAAFAWLAR
ncbi:hypothetical protein DVA67_016635 [Solirubrobacter sp. CPCC 204708]|uniref:Phospholipase n=1 Tax=Solirubrobacter deserti TaxID=2282478 RepID=A0ABT4RJ90_9ACTN|nr:PHB depolymerase family esterase [Solirubrobacter deserti]MBE2317611.1 hypothetical protein [Solirubrobacter deserti]MDA0138560.1 hypothetical protein [Solirubrobacter deserti]